MFAVAGQRSLRSASMRRFDGIARQVEVGTGVLKEINGLCRV
jgi:hypothetical protein